MKKKSLFIATILSCIFINCFAYGETDQEILFRNVPWSTNYSEVQSLLPEFDWYAMSYEYMKTYSVDDVLLGDYEGIDFNNGGINMTAMPFTNKEIEVAGYTTCDIQLYFSYIPVDGKLTQDENDTALYAAMYEFTPQNLKEMSSDLIDKLSSLYGEPDDKFTSTDWLNLATTCITWNGANDTVVTLRAVDTSKDTTDLYDDELYISYAWRKGDELLQTASDTIDANNSAAEAENYGNGNTDGL